MHKPPHTLDPRTSDGLDTKFRQSNLGTGSAGVLCPADSNRVGVTVTLYGTSWQNQRYDVEIGVKQGAVTYRLVGITLESPSAFLGIEQFGALIKGELWWVSSAPDGAIHSVELHRYNYGEF